MARTPAATAVASRATPAASEGLVGNLLPAAKVSILAKFLFFFFCRYSDVRTFLNSAAPPPPTPPSKGGKIEN